MRFIPIVVDMNDITVVIATEAGLNKGKPSTVLGGEKSLKYFEGKCQRPEVGLKPQD